MGQRPLYALAQLLLDVFLAANIRPFDRRGLNVYLPHGRRSNGWERCEDVTDGEAGQAFLVPLLDRGRRRFAYQRRQICPNKSMRARGEIHNVTHRQLMWQLLQKNLQYMSSSVCVGNAFLMSRDHLSTYQSQSLYQNVLVVSAPGLHCLVDSSQQ